jgi:hypothetical protein
VALSALFCSFGLEQWAQSKHLFFSEYSSLTNFATALVVGFAICVQIVRFGGLQTITKYPVVGWLIGCLLLFTAISSTWSLYDEARKGIISSVPYFLAYTVLCPLVVNRPRDLYDGLLATLILGSGIALLLLFTSEWGYRSIIIHSYGFRGAQSGNPLAIGTMGGYVFIIAVMLHFSRSSRFWKVLRWGFALLGMALCVMSQSRGQVFGSAIGAMVALPMNRGARGIKGLGVLLIALLLVGTIMVWTMFEFADPERWSPTSMEEDLRGGRVYKTLIVLERWWETPSAWVTGLGSSASFSSELIGFYPHNVPGEILAEEGMVGFTIYASILLLTLRSIYRLYHRLKHFNDARGMLAAITGILALQFINSCKQGSLLGSSEFFGLVIIIGQLERSVASQDVQVA